MQILVQSDIDIPIHIRSTVDARSAKLEEQLVKEHRSSVKHVKRNNTNQIDVGLTVSEDRTSNSGTRLRSRQQSSALFNDNENDNDEIMDKENRDLRGRSIYKFQANLRKSVNTMMKRATSAITEADIEDQNLSEEVTESLTVRRSARTKKSTKKKQEMEQASSKKRAIDHTKRRKFLRQVELMRNDRANSADEEEEDEMFEDDEDDEQHSHPTDKMDIDEDEDEDGTTGGKSSATFEKEGYERYFQDLHYTAKTSNNTLSKLQILEPQQFKDILEKAPSKHKEEVLTLSNMHRQFFSQWYFELHSGFNLLFYGYGSKRNLLNEFAQTCLTEGPLIVVNGFFPSVSIKDILLKITAGALELTGPTGSLQDHIQFICDYFAEDNREYECLYILIHNLDGANLRNERTQAALSMLASATNIHVIASVDHINTGLLWDNVKSTRFNWIWHDATTFDNYLVETSFENSLLVRSSEVGGARGAKYVLDSLTTNARGVFKILAEHQLQEMAESNMEGRGNETVGLTYGQYYQKCRDQFFVSSDLALRTELTEFRDHKLISTKKALDGTEIFYIPLDQNTLTGLVEQLN
ncbi:origin recognition complex subunit 2-domain-containing protein [Mycotypha africana]|uniref:origin recognition complex subunit 2-domain-containing protein n=1 Tax=Mycotypha africana TaxID=64632 RepID=UPI0023010BDD|nr:origin recognition complex subunit 2-domain-containing protein [Mycotypha africana]KAI8992127.1 origin recognition complex subunit 2-domain-containing protein [Mycotypha africana]